MSPLPDWYQAKRASLEQLFMHATRVGAPIVHGSPSGKYILEVTNFSLGSVRFGATTGVVSRAGETAPLARVLRNFVSFPHAFCENHPDGHDYLLCGEDYQGSTVVQLDTGVRVDAISDRAQQGSGFCQTHFHPTPDRRRLFVEGCIWAAPYELLLYDFADPMALPYRELRRWPGARQRGGLDKVEPFAADGSLTFTCYTEYDSRDGRLLDELSEEEQDALEASGREDAVVKEGKLQFTWYPDGTERVLRLWESSP